MCFHRYTVDGVCMDCGHDASHTAEVPRVSLLAAPIEETRTVSGLVPGRAGVKPAPIAGAGSAETIPAP